MWRFQYNETAQEVQASSILIVLYMLLILIMSLDESVLQLGDLGVRPGGGSPAGFRESPAQPGLPPGLRAALAARLAPPETACLTAHGARLFCLFDE